MLALSLSQSPNSSEYFQRVLFVYVKQSYGSEVPYPYRREQVRAESNYNPRASSDFAGWKKAKLDTVSAIKQRKGAAGLSQFIWPTAQRYGAKTISPSQAESRRDSADIYNPYWSLRSMCSCMKDISKILLTTKNPKARRALTVNRSFQELCATASYNTGEGRIRDRLNKHGASWERIKYSILPEPRLYAEKIIRAAEGN